MKTAWTKGMDEKQQEEMISCFSSSAFLRMRGIELCREKIEANRKSSISSSAYDSPNWAYKQADAVGYERAMQEIISLFS